MTTKRLFASIITLLAVVTTLGFAQAPATAPAGSTGLCNDGTYITTATKSGACKGHKGVKDWYGPAKAATAAPAATSAATSAASTTAAAAQKATPTAAPKAMANPAPAAPGGGAGQVWLNTASNVYHCPGTPYYGKTKAGAYMTEAEAKAKGAHADHGKSCQ
jgi:hypothetical protein